jgi:hemerythrin-like domain-containing protein
MKKATDSLLSDHKMIRKLLEAFHTDNPRFADIAKTMERVALTHAWFEDTVFLPALKKEPLLVKAYIDELYDEHEHIELVLQLIRKTDISSTVELTAYVRQFRAIMENHLKKEEDALFPLAEQVLDNEGMNNLSAEMERKQKEAPP